MAIRTAGKRELEIIMQHAGDVMKESVNGYVKPSREKALQNISQLLSNGGYYLVQTENSVLQGWIGVGWTFDFHSDEMVGFISEIYVIPDYRKQGIAEELCKVAFKQLEREGFKQVQLQVFSGNPAKLLYEKLGFRDVSVLMGKNLD
jgi:ribosomal protein S18 acetylase RimI-like enzyme